MVKQSAAAQRKADAETRKAAKASATAKASKAAAGSTTAVAGSSQAAVAAGPQAIKGTAKQARAACAAALPQAEAEADSAVVTAVAAGGKAGKAELHTDADSGQVRQPADTQVSPHHRCTRHSIEEMKSLHASSCGLWEALVRPTASQPQKRIECGWGKT